MKFSIISFALVVGIFSLTGCASTSLVQAKLTASEARAQDLSDRLELAEGKIQEIRAEASKDATLCQDAMTKYHEVVTATGNLYDKEKPVVIQAVTDAYNTAKPVVEEKANAAYNWASDTVKAQLPKSGK